MNPLPIAITVGIVAIVPPLRRRVVPVTKAVLDGALGVAGAALGAAVGVADVAINGPGTEPSED